MNLRLCAGFGSKRSNFWPAASMNELVNFYNYDSENLHFRWRSVAHKPGCLHLKNAVVTHWKRALQSSEYLFNKNINLKHQRRMYVTLRTCFLFTLTIPTGTISRENYCISREEVYWTDKRDARYVRFYLAPLLITVITRSTQVIVFSVTGRYCLDQFCKNGRERGSRFLHVDYCSQHNTGLVRFWMCTKG